jgi:hypothetical protein
MLTPFDVVAFDAMVFLLPVKPLQGREPAFAKAWAGTGMVALHVGWPRI